MARKKNLRSLGMHFVFFCIFKAGKFVAHNFSRGAWLSTWRPSWRSRRRSSQSVVQMPCYNSTNWEEANRSPCCHLNHWRPLMRSWDQVEPLRSSWSEDWRLLSPRNSFPRISKSNPSTAQRRLASWLPGFRFYSGCHGGPLPVALLDGIPKARTWELTPGPAAKKSENGSNLPFQTLVSTKIHRVCGCSREAHLYTPPWN